MRSPLSWIALALAIILAVAIVQLRIRQSHDSSIVVNGPLPHASCAPAVSAFRAHRSNVWLTVSARVSRVLSDSHGQYTHQRFIVICPNRSTLLIVNDISIGKRVPAHAGDRVVVRGQYVWNSQGGLIHFTHHDPEGGTGGWIVERGVRYALEPSTRPVGIR